MIDYIKYWLYIANPDDRKRTLIWRKIVGRNCKPVHYVLSKIWSSYRGNTLKNESTLPGGSVNVYKREFLSWVFQVWIVVSGRQEEFSKTERTTFSKDIFVKNKYIISENVIYSRTHKLKAGSEHLYEKQKKTELEGRQEPQYGSPVLVGERLLNCWSFYVKEGCFPLPTSAGENPARHYFHSHPL